MKINKISFLIGVTLFSLIPLASYSANNSFTIKNNAINVNIAQINNVAAYSTGISSASWKVSTEKGVITKIVYQFRNNYNGSYIFKSENFDQAQQKKNQLIKAVILII